MAGLNSSAPPFFRTVWPRAVRSLPLIVPNFRWQRGTLNRGTAMIDRAWYGWQEAPVTYTGSKDRRGRHATGRARPLRTSGLLTPRYRAVTAVMPARQQAPSRGPQLPTLGAFFVPLDSPFGQAYPNRARSVLTDPSCCPEARRGPAKAPGPSGGTSLGRDVWRGSMLTQRLSRRLARSYRLGRYSKFAVYRATKSA